MAKQDINIGSGVNKGDGDTLRDALRKANENFTEVYNTLDIASGTGSFLGLSDTPTAYPQDPGLSTQIVTMNEAKDGLEFTSEISPDNITGIHAVATSGDYNDLSNTPTLANVAITGRYSSLTGTPTLATVALSASYNDLQDRPNLSQVAVSGEFYDLLNRPDVPATLTDLGIADGTDGQVLSTDGQGNFEFIDAGGGVGSNLDWSYVTNTPTTLAGYGITDTIFSGDYNSLTNKPTIPTATSDLTNDSGFITALGENDVTTALGFIPYNSSNPNGYIDGIVQSDVVTALGFLPSNFDGDYNNLTNKPTTYDDLLDLSDVDDSSLSVGNVLVYRNIDGSNVWKTEPLEVQDIANINTTGISDGSILTYNASASEWQIGTALAGTDTLDSVIQRGATTNTLTTFSAGINTTSITSATTLSLGGTISFTVSSTVDANGIKLSNVGDPTLAQDVATKNYVDTAGFLTTEADTLATVTARGAATTTTSVIPFYYADEASFPNATTYHGAVAHAHNTGKLYYAHGGNWVKLADYDDLVDGAITWTLTSNGSDDYVFSGPGIQSGNTNDPELYLMRGYTYKFDNTVAGSHPFEIRTTAGGSAYTPGISTDGDVTIFTVPMDSPDTLYYQCTSHGVMLGTINIVGAGGGISIESPTEGNMIYYDGSAWEQTAGPVLHYTITADGSSAYLFDGPGITTGVTNPTLYLYKGFTYIFNNTTGTNHPFEIRDSDGGSAFTEGVSGSSTATQTFTVPHNISDTALVYQCTIHSGMVGDLVIV